MTSLKKKVAFTYNLKLSDRIEEAEFDSRSTVEAIVGAIGCLGYQIEPIEVSGLVSQVISKLEVFKPDLVFNTAEGKEGRFREAFYPSLFEQLQIPYAGSDPYSCLLTLDKALTKQVLKARGVLTPRWLSVASAEDLKDCDLSFPLIVKPNFEGSSKGIQSDSVVEDRAELEARVLDRLDQFPDGLLVEEYISGKDIIVPFLEGASPATLGILPPYQYLFDEKLIGHRKFEIYDYELKNDLSDAVSVQMADRFSASETDKIQRLASHISKTLRIRDFGRIDFRLSSTGELYFIEINALPSLEPESGIFQAAKSVGLPNYSSVFDCIINSARKRTKASSCQHSLSRAAYSQPASQI
ncbi:MAG: hypothetical protein ABIQ95_02165 [Bdellovibrionia bacterium]